MALTRGSTAPVSQVVQPRFELPWTTKLLMVVLLPCWPGS
jgi:hypothetical protein